jgi:purine-binding chemotaxis protein CheW
MNTSAPYVLFELAGSLYGVHSRDVRHVEMLEHLTPVPNTAPSLEGIVFSRGRVVPALNLRVRFGLPRENPTARTRLVYLEAHDRLVALIVDAAREFCSIPADAIKPVEETLHGIRGNYLKGVVTVRERLVFLIDVSAVLAPEEVELPPQAASLTAAARS